MLQTSTNLFATYPRFSRAQLAMSDCSMLRRKYTFHRLISNQKPRDPTKGEHTASGSRFLYIT